MNSAAGIQLHREQTSAGYWTPSRRDEMGFGRHTPLGRAHTGAAGAGDAPLGFAFVHGVLPCVRPLPSWATSAVWSTPVPSAWGKGSRIPATPPGVSPLCGGQHGASRALVKLHAVGEPEVRSGSAAASAPPCLGSPGSEQREVANRLGTTQSAMARLVVRGGELRLSTLTGYAEAVAADVALFQWGLVASCSAAIRDGITRGDADTALRAVLQLFHDLPRAGHADTETRVEPPTAGSPRWDAVIGTATERAARLRSVAVPGGMAHRHGSTSCDV